TNVDMARLKAEFLHQYYRQHGLPWRNRVFGHIATLSRIASRLGPAANWLIQSRPGRWLGERILGIDRRRVLPALARRPLNARSAAFQAANRSNHYERTVLLFCDTFTRFYEPDLAIAARQLLAAAGCGVELGSSEDHAVASLRCC